MDLLIISGLSGAGKSKASGVLEDMDYYCVDNLPVALIPKFTELCFATKGYERVALVTDIRSQENFSQLFDVLKELDGMGVSHKILYMDADVKTIAKRYKETRRKHPLDHGGANVEEAIRREIELLKPMREIADYVIDTTGLTLGQLQAKVRDCIGGPQTDGYFKVNIISFGYKHGVPIDADLVFDTRFLPNPYYDPALRDLRGTDEPVRKFLFGYELTKEFMEKLTDLMVFLIPNFVEEGKNALVVCIGCTGGHHRSVAVAAELAKRLQEKGFHAECIHRDINR